MNKQKLKVYLGEVITLTYTRRCSGITYNKTVMGRLYHLTDNEASIMLNYGYEIIVDYNDIVEPVTLIES